MSRWLKWIALIGGILLAAAQLYSPARTNPSIDPKLDLSASVQMDPVVSGVFARSCNDCHSNRTVWPFYSRIAPGSWLVVSDVNRGRQELNFSNWAAYSSADQRKHLAKICQEMSEGEMPGLPYLLLHRDAAVTKQDIAVVCRWTAEQSAIVASKE